MTSSATMAVHKSSMASSPESPVSNGGESFAVKVGAKKDALNFNHLHEEICEFTSISYIPVWVGHSYYSSTRWSQGQGKITVYCNITGLYPSEHTIQSYS